MATLKFKTADTSFQLQGDDNIFNVRSLLIVQQLTYLVGLQSSD